MKHTAVVYNPNTRSLYRYFIDPDRKLRVEERKHADSQWEKIEDRNIKEDFVGFIVDNRTLKPKNQPMSFHVNTGQRLLTCKDKQDSIKQFNFQKSQLEKYWHSSTGNNSDPNEPKKLNSKALKKSLTNRGSRHIYESLAKDAQNPSINSHNYYFQENRTHGTHQLKSSSALNEKGPGIDLHTIFDNQKEDLNESLLVPNQVSFNSSTPYNNNAAYNATAMKQAGGSNTYTQTMTQTPLPESKQEPIEFIQQQNASGNENKKYILGLSIAAVLIGGSLAHLAAGVMVAAIALLVISAFVNFFLEKNKNKKEKDVKKDTNDEKESGLSWIDKFVLGIGAIVMFCTALGAIPTAIGIAIFFLCAAVKILHTVFSSKKIDRKASPGKNLFKNSALLLGGIFGIVGTLMLFSLLGPAFGAVCLIGFAIMACVALCRQLNLHNNLYNIVKSLHDPRINIPRKPKEPIEPKKPIQGKNESDEKFKQRTEKYKNAFSKYEEKHAKYEKALEKYNSKIEGLKKESEDAEKEYNLNKATYEKAEKILNRFPNNNQAKKLYHEAKILYEESSKRLDKAIFIHHKTDKVGQRYTMSGEMKRIKTSIVNNFQQTTKNFSSSYHVKLPSAKNIINKIQNNLDHFDDGFKKRLKVVFGDVPKTNENASTENNDTPVQKQAQ